MVILGGWVGLGWVNGYVTCFTRLYFHFVLPSDLIDPSTSSFLPPSDTSVSVLSSVDDPTESSPISDDEVFLLIV